MTHDDEGGGVAEVVRGHVAESEISCLIQERKNVTLAITAGAPACQPIRSQNCCVSTNQTSVFISHNNQSDISFDQSKVRIICDNQSEASIISDNQSEVSIIIDNQSEVSIISDNQSEVSIISDNQSEESIYLTTLDTPGHDSNAVVVVTILDDHGGAAVSVTSGVNGRGGLGHAHHSTGDHPRPEGGDTA